MQLYKLKPAKGSTKRKKIVGRGNGSGHGTYCCRGMNGQKSRAGYSKRSGFEGGRTPLYRQIPKLRGFKSIHIKPEVLNLSDLNKFKDGDKIDKKKMLEARLIRFEKSKVKVLGDGKLTKKIIIEADQFSKTAQEKIEKVGGVVQVIKVKSNKIKKKPYMINDKK